MKGEGGGGGGGEDVVYMEVALRTCLEHRLLGTDVAILQ